MMEVRLAVKEDIAEWMALVELVKEAFPGLETEKAMTEYRETVLQCVEGGGAACAECDGVLAGVLLFSRELHLLGFLAVHPAYRRQHIAEALVEFMLAQTGREHDITVTTYCEGVPGGRAARAFYRHMGFSEGRLTEEFGAVVQEFVLPAERK